MAKSLIPKSKAKTAYGLLSEIRKIILAEPKRYDQRYFRVSLNDLRHGFYSVPAEVVAPQCGTIGCVAGWVCALKAPDVFVDETRIQSTASDILGAHGFSFQLFDAKAAGPRIDENPVAHARRGAAHIAKFQKKHAKQLKAKRV